MGDVDVLDSDQESAEFKLYQNLLENVAGDDSPNLEPLIKNLSSILKRNFSPTFPHLHIQFCLDLIEEFIQRPNLDPAQTKELLLLPALSLVQDAIEANDGHFMDFIMKSKLLNSLSRLVAFCADISDLMIKDLSKACALETLLSHSESVSSENILLQQLEMDRVPAPVAKLCECRNVILQHPYNCECLECMEEENAASQDMNPLDKNPIDSNNKNPMLMECGQEGKIVWPHRCLQYHKAAICCVNSFWSLLEFRSKKIAEVVKPILDEQKRTWIGIGDMVAVASKEISWISYEPTSPTAPCLPEFVRAFVLTECPLPLVNGYRGLWLPDYAARALCKPDRLIPLPKDDPICNWKPLVFIGSAYSPPPNGIISCAISIIYSILVPDNLDDALVILDGKGPWRAFQLIKCLEGNSRVEFLAILNMLASHSEKGNRGLIACCIHNFLADWFVWLIHSKKSSTQELEILMDGINLFLPRIEVKRWPKSRLLYGAANALLKCCPSEKLQKQLNTCIQTLTWEIGGRFSRQNRRHNEVNQQLQIDSDTLLRAESISIEKNENSKAQLSLEESKLSDFTMIRKHWPGETWLLPSRTTLSLFAVPEPVFEDTVLKMRSNCPTLIRGLIYTGANQGVHCEVMKVRGIRDIRQPAFAKLVCGMLNAGGGDIWIGLGDSSRVEGVFVHRTERDSFSQGILDVATYSIEPRLLPFNLEVEQILALDKPRQELHPDRNRYVYRVAVKPLEGVKYVALPEKECLSRREPDGETIIKK